MLSHDSGVVQHQTSLIHYFLYWLDLGCAPVRIEAASASNFTPVLLPFRWVFPHFYWKAQLKERINPWCHSN